MEITDVRIRLAGYENDRLCGYCTITIDGEFVVRDLRIIAGEKGLFVAMPSRKTTRRCPHCGGKNSHQARFCSDCGKPQRPRQQSPSDQARLHVDIAHPITPECRHMLQERVLEAFVQEKEREELDGQRGPDLDDAGAIEQREEDFEYR